MSQIHVEESGGKAIRSDRWIRAMLAHVAGLTGCKYFVETGTEYGDTAKWASGVFPQVVTVEASPEHYALSGGMLAGCGNVRRVFGDSTLMLRQVDEWVPPGEPAMFYLDTHWSTGPIDDAYYGRNTPNPLMRELGMLRNRIGVNYIFVDDVRMFAYPGYVPKGSTQTNPSLRDIVLTLYDYEIAIYADCFMCLPYAGTPPPIEIINSWRKAIHKTWLDILV